MCFLFKIAWIMTFAAVVILDISLGLYIGIGFSILLVVLQSQRAVVSTLGNIPHTDIYETIEFCEEVNYLN